MGTRSSEAIGRRIKAAREDAGLTQEELAHQVRLDRSALAKIETGTRKVSALELALIAERLDVRIEWFVNDAPEAVLSRRNMREPGAASPTIDKLTERVAREVEFVMAHDEQLNALSTPEPLDRPTTRTSVEAAAMEARRLLDSDPGGPLIDLSRRVTRAGLLAFSVDLGADAADGSSMLLRNGGIAVVNGTLHVGRRRLTLAHEFGHYLFADEFSVDWQVASTDQPDSREAKIDHFARALLLPAQAIERSWETHREQHSLRESAVIIASQYRVDMSTLARRLSELRLVNNGEAQQVRGCRTTRADIVDFDLLIHEELSPPELPHDYVEAVLRIYRHEVVSGARALDLLLNTWDEADLPELPTLPEQAIWSFVS
jgi:Zn-dependent peptidase ImmA (M78 family)/transcriptional regulator with XRE-family HTH domain